MSERTFYNCDNPPCTEVAEGASFSWPPGWTHVSTRNARYDYCSEACHRNHILLQIPVVQQVQNGIAWPTIVNQRARR